MVDTATETPFAVVLAPQPMALEPLGGKGGSLARLVQAGHPVPASGVVTTAAFRAVEAANPSIGRLIESINRGDVVPEDVVDGVFAEAVVPSSVRLAIVEMVRSVGRAGVVETGSKGAVAVRSSATVEDLAGSSFAGQYRSYLDVDSTDAGAAMDAVRRVWASLWHPAPAAYRRAFGIESAGVAMAVVVMAMVPASTAGVVFTVDPAGSQGARVEAVEGLGESLVSGERTPAAFVVPRSTDSAELGDMPWEARRALELALAVEADFGVPQDVEWAAVGDEVFVVQARPITVLEESDGFDTVVDDHELTTAGIAEMVPGVLPALCWELNRFLLEEAFRSVLDNLGIIRGAPAEERPFIRRVRGRAALDFTQLREAAADIPGAVEQLEIQYFGHPDVNVSPARTGRRNRTSLRRDIHTLRTRGKVTDQAEVLIAAVAGIRDRRPDLASFSDDETLAYVQRLLDLATRGLAGELGVAAAGGAAYDELVRVLERHLGAGEGEPAALAVTAHAGAAVERVGWASAAVFAGPSWDELGSTAAVPPVSDDQRSADLAALRNRLRSLPGWRWRRILTAQFVDVRMHLVRRLVRDVIDQLRRREAAKAALLELGGEVRCAHVELGRRLVDRGVLTASADVELLTTGEIVEGLQGDLDLHTDALRRRRNWLGRYEVEGELPVRFRGVPDREPVPLPEGDVLEGWAASPGRHRGSARVVANATGRLEPGEVLVAESTDASWSPLFVKAGAIVVERGGPLSHAAILARELGLPAVLNVPGATGALDGCAVSVDGDQGLVVIESRPERS